MNIYYSGDIRRHEEETKAIYVVCQDLLHIPFLQSKQGLAWKIAELLYKLGYRRIKAVK